MEIRDSLTVDAAGLTLTRDGYVVGEAKVSRAFNVQQYLGSELGLTGDDGGRVFGVYRDPEVVFDEKAMLSLAGRPVTRGHPAGEVNAANWKDLAKGAMGGTIKRDGEHVVASMVIMDADAAKEVMDGARSLSAGYTVSVVKDEGTAPDGTPYQYRQAGELRFNHVAYLPDNNPRAGNTRIGDDAKSWGASPVILPTADMKGSPMADNLHKVLVDGLQVETTDAGAAAIEKLTKDKADLAAKLSDAEKAHASAVADAASAHEKAIAAKDAELAKKDAEIDALKAKVVDEKALDAKVQARADLIATAHAIAKDVKSEGLSDAEIRKAVVVAKLGDALIAGKPEAYIDARFDILADEAKAGADPVRAALLSRDTSTKVTDNGQAAYEKRLADAWKGA